MSEKTSQFTISDQFVAISQWNPGITLSSRDLAAINSGDLILVGHGSIIDSGLTKVKKGCINYLRYQNSGTDLTFFLIDGAYYSPSNLKDFQGILEKAALHGKCINFCYYKSSKKMTMLNVYPQCCCRCEESHV